MAGAPLYRRAYPLPPGTVTLISLLYTLTPILITPFKGPMYDTKYYVDNNPPPPTPPTIAILSKAFTKSVHYCSRIHE